MAMPLAGTFQYLAIVPPEEERETDWRVRMDELVAPWGDELVRSRLVGHAPRLRITDCEAQPESASRIAIPRSRVTLRASGKKHASVSEASFFIDQRIRRSLQTGDRLYMTRTCTGGLGLSLIRADRLIFAVGAVTSVPLGTGVAVRIPSDLVTAANRAFQSRDPHFAFPEHPLELQVEGELRILLARRETMKSYEVSVLHGFRPGIPGEAECAAITLIGSCKHAFGFYTAELIDSMELEMS